MDTDSPSLSCQAFQACKSRHVDLQVEQARFLVPPFTLKEPVFAVEEQQPRQQQAEPPQQGGTRSLLADLRYPTAIPLCISSPQYPSASVPHNTPLHLFPAIPLGSTP